MKEHKRIEPGPGQESVWDYPRPPRVEDSTKHIQVMLNGVMIADTHRAKRVLETSHPPVYYIPVEDIQMQYFKPAQRTTFCEFKGAASYYTIIVGDKVVSNAAWYYAHPTHPYEAIQGYVAIYPGKMDACILDGEQVRAQEGDFYGGWITSDVVGPFKGAVGTSGW